MSQVNYIVAYNVFCRIMNPYKTTMCPLCNRHSRNSASACLHLQEIHQMRLVVHDGQIFIRNLSLKMSLKVRQRIAWREQKKKERLQLHLRHQICNTQQQVQDLVHQLWWLQQSHINLVQQLCDTLYRSPIPRYHIPLIFTPNVSH